MEFTEDRLVELHLEGREAEYKALVFLDEVLKPLLSSVTYKPGTSIQAVQYVEPYILLVVITMKVDHLTNPEDKKQWVTHNIQLNFANKVNHTRESILKLVFENIVFMETHEAKEWLRVDGKQYIDPHPGGYS
jgi:hypothetical protein